MMEGRTEHRVPLLGANGEDVLSDSEPPVARSLSEDSLSEDEPSQKGRTTTAGLLNSVMIMERLTEQILPAMSRTLACAFTATPQDLGYIAFWRAFVQSLAAPLGGLAGHRYNRILVVVAGCVVWIACAAAFAFIDTSVQAMKVWAFVGLGLGLIIPNAQSIIADYYPTTRRGFAFGTLQLTSALGAVLGTLYATTFNEHPDCKYDDPGCWRFTFLAIAAISFSIGLCTWLFATDPSCPAGQLRQPHHPADGATEASGSAIGRLAAPCAVFAAAPTPHSHGSGLPPLLQLIGLDKSAADEVAVVVGHRCDRGGGRRGGGGGGGSPGVGGDSGWGVKSAAVAAAAEATSSAARPPCGALTGDKLREILSIPTFLIIVLQGSVGSIPSSAMGYLTWYLQLLGMTNAQAGALTALYLVGGALGGLLGGWIGDAVARRYPDCGRIAVVQFCVAIGIPFAALLLKGMPTECYMPGGVYPPPPPPLSPAAPDGADPGVCFVTQSTTFAMYAALLFVFGLLTTWAAPACNNPVFSEIVPAHMRTLIYSFDRSFEGAISALGSIIVGYLAQHFVSTDNGTFVPSPADCANSEAVGRKQQQAQALGSALLWLMAVSWTLCVVFYTGLYWTYPRDRDRARRRRRARDFASAQRLAGLGGGGV